MAFFRIKYLLLIILLGSAAYSNSLHGEFQFDDMDFIVNNPAIRDLGDVKAIFHSHGVPLRFVSFLSFAANYHFHGLEVFGYHLVNLIIHIINALLVMWLARLLLGSVKDKKIIALFAALIFLLHPIQTEAVSYIAQRFASLATLFYLAALCCFIEYKRRTYNNEISEISDRDLFPNKQKGNRSLSLIFSLIFLAAALAFGLVATFTKQIAFTLPVMVLLYDLYFPQSRTGASRCAPTHKKIAWAIAGAFLLLMPLMYQFNAGAIIGRDYPSRSHEGDYIYWLTYGLTQFRVIGTYLRLLIWPAGLNFDHDFQVSTSLFEPKIFACFLIILVLFYAAVRLYRTNRLVSFCLLWFFITLSVESTVIVLPHVIFEHRMYLPMAGVSILISYGFFSLIRNQRAAIAVLALILAVFGHLTYERNKVWQDGIALWSDVIQKSPHKSRPYHNRGYHYLNKGDFRQALADFNKTIELEPLYIQAYSNRATAYRGLGDIQAALADYNKAIELNAGNVQAFHNRAQLYAQMGQYDRAFADYAAALKIQPKYYLAYYNRGRLWLSMKQYDKALADLSRAIEIHPDFPYNYAERGKAYLYLEQKERAYDDFSTCLSLNPKDESCLANRKLAR